MYECIFLCMYVYMDLYIHLYTCILLYDLLFVDCLVVSVVEYEVNHKTGTQLSIENENWVSCQLNAGLA